MCQPRSRSIEQAPLSFILIDIDYFKRYNDRYGHPEGDECLRRVAGSLASTLRRPGDLVARYGGEELAVVLPNTPLEGAVTVAEALRTAVEALRIAHAGSEAADHVTLSVGVGSSATQGGSIVDLVAATDAALYEAKRGGRNRVASALPPA